MYKKRLAIAVMMLISISHVSFACSKQGEDQSRRMLFQEITGKYFRKFAATLKEQEKKILFAEYYVNLAKHEFTSKEYELYQDIFW